MDRFPGIHREKWVVLLCFLFLPFVCSSQDQCFQKPVTRTYAVTNARVIQAPGKVLPRATVIIKDGFITAVGKDIPIPPDAQLVDGDSLYIYAGFVDGLSHAGVTTPSSGVSMEKPKDPGNPSPERAGITPQNDVRDHLNACDKSLTDLRKVGFGTAHVVPRGVFLPGRAAIVLLGGNNFDRMVLEDRSALFSELSWHQGAYPSTVVGVMAKFRQLYREARQNKSYEALYASNRTGLERPSQDRILEAFYPVIDKTKPMLFRAELVLDIHRVISLQRDLDFPLIIGEVKEGWQMIDKIKSSGAKPFLSLTLPEEVKDEEETKDDSVKLDPEKEALLKRRKETIDQYVSQAATFEKAGVKFGFSTWCVKSSDVRKNLGRMIKAGLSEQTALAALTVNAAELLGIADRVGTVEPGKIANLVITDKPYFEEESRVEYVFVDGLPYKQEEKDKSGKTKDTYEGAWALVTETPQGKNDLKIMLKKTDNYYSGTITDGKMPEPKTLKSVEASGNKMKVVYEYKFHNDIIEIVIEGTVEGKKFKGNMAVGQYGTYPIEGSKVPE